jgi:Zn-dependent protease with chaperone function
VNTAELERQPLFRRALWKRNGYLLLVVALEFALLYLLACLRVEVPAREPGCTEPPAGHLFLGYELSLEPFAWRTVGRIALFLAVLMGTGHYLFRRALKADGMIQLYPADQSGERTFGRLRGGQVVELVLELARQMGLRVSRIVIAVKPEPNAFTANLLGLGHVVVLHSNLFDILPRDGLRAVIAHELAHVRRRDSLLYQMARLPVLFSFLIAFLGALTVLAGLLQPETFVQFLTRALFVVITAGLTLLAFALFGRISNLAMQQSELIADAYAAQVCGWGSLLNALLLLGQRTEAIRTLFRVLRDTSQKVGQEAGEAQLLRVVNRFPPGELDEGRASKAAPRLFVIDQLEMLKTGLGVPLTDEQIRDLAARAQVAPDEQTGEPVDEKNLTDWRDFDRDHSGQLDPQEAAALVQELRKDPRRMIFRRYLNPDARWENHPTMRDRVLHLYDLFAGQQALFGSGQRA